MDEAGNPIKGILAEEYESYGTVRLINLLPLIFFTLKNGGILIADELDASIHPMILMNIVNIFHNDEINKKHAQLVFNTHNPVFLNRNIFRSDEIKFIERNDQTNGSECYSLSDFGMKELLENEDYLNNYFVDRYGAIKYIDFSSMFERMINFTEGESKNG